MQGTADTEVYALATSGANLFIGTIDSGAYLSTNNGMTWTAINTGLSRRNIISLAVSGTNIFAGMTLTFIYQQTMVQTGLRSIQD